MGRMRSMLMLGVPGLMGGDNTFAPSCAIWTLDDNAATALVAGNLVDGVLVGGNTSNVAAVVDGHPAFHLDGSTQYVVVDFVSIQPTANHIRPSEIGSLWTKYASNPVLGTPAASVYFGQVVKNPAGGWFYFGAYLSSIYRWESDDLITWTNETLVLTHGAGGAWDETIQTNVTFQKPDGSWVMLYRGLAGTTYQIGLATSPDGTTFTKKDNGGVDDGLFPQFDDNYDPTCVLLLDSTYYVYVNGDPNHGVQHVYTSADDFATFTPYAGNPIFPNPYSGYSSYCCTVWVYGGAYYMLIPRGCTSSAAAEHKNTIALYRCPDPYFDQSNRVYLGRVLLADQTYDATLLDTPSVPVTDVYRNVYAPEFSNTLYTMYTGLDAGSAGTQALAYTTLTALSSRPSITELHSLLITHTKSFSFWVQFDTISENDVVFGVGPAKATATDWMAVIKLGVLKFFMGGGYRSTTFSPVVDTIYHIAVVDNVTNTKVYVNKSLVGTLNYTSVITNSMFLYIGAGYGAGGFLDGYIWDFRLFDTALSAEEVGLL